MKALLVEDTSGKENRPAIIFLPSGKLKPDHGDPANVIIEAEGDNLRVWVLNKDELLDPPFKTIREVEINGRLFLKALDYRNARIEYGRRKVEFKNKLLHESVAPGCDALTFLNRGLRTP